MNYLHKLFEQMVAPINQSKSAIFQYQLRLVKKGPGTSILEEDGISFRKMAGILEFLSAGSFHKSVSVDEESVR